MAWGIGPGCTQQGAKHLFRTNSGNRRAPRPGLVVPRTSRRAGGGLCSVQCKSYRTTISYFRVLLAGDFISLSNVMYSIGGLKQDVRVLGSNFVREAEISLVYSSIFTFNYNCNYMIFMYL